MALFMRVFQIRMRKFFDFDVFFTKEN